METSPRECGHRKPFFLIPLLLIIAGILLSQKFGFSWGSLQLASPSTITVTGYADGSQLNQKASFTATITTENADKNQAVKELTDKTNTLIDQVKASGIEAKNIKTENLQVYEFEDYIYTVDGAEVELMYRPDRPYKTVKKWRASNSLHVTVEESAKATELSTLLLNSEATNVSGPNFESGDTAELEKDLLAKAMQNAEEKANTILKNSKQKVVKVLQVSESSYAQPYPMAYKSALPMTGGGMMEDTVQNINVEPGSQTMTKTVTVIFEIK